MTSAPPLALRPAPSGLAGHVSRAICLVVPLALWFVHLPMDVTSQHAVAIASFMVLGWITEVMDYAVTGLIGCFLFWVLNIVPFNTAFGGFASATPWFLLGAMLIGVTASKSGLAKRLAYWVMLRVGVTYPRILFGLILTDFLLTLIVPSGIARIVILAAVALGLVEAFRAQAGGNVARGMFLIITYAAALFDKMIIAGASSITARGLIRRAGEVDVQWSLWFAAFLPCVVVTIVAAWALILWLFPPEKVSLEGGYDYLKQELQKLGPFSTMEKRAAILIGAATLLWMTDFIHHISSAKIGLGIGLLALVPYVGILRSDDLRNVNYLPVFFVAAALSMASVLQTTKSIALLTDITFAWMQPLMTGLLTSTAVLYWTAFVYHIVLSSDIPMLGTSLPLLMNFAKTHGFNPLALGMIWTFASAGKIFAYQSAVLVVGYSFGFFGARDLLKVGFLITLVEFVALLIVVPLYWPLIGIH